MPSSRSLIASFVAGVVTPRKSLDANYPYYQQALSEGRNFFITPQGTLFFREGFKRMFAAGVATEPSRSIQWHRGGDVNDNMLEIKTDGEIIIRDQDSTLATLTNHNWDDPEQLDNLYFHNEERVGVIAHKDHPPYYLKRNLSGAWTGSHLEFALVPLSTFDDEKSPSNAATDSTYVVDFTGTAAGDEYSLTYGGAVTTQGSPLEPIDFTARWTNTNAVNEVEILRGIEGTSWVTPTTVVDVTAAGSTVTINITGKNSGKELAFQSRTPGNEDPTVTQTGIISGGDEPAWSYPYVVEHSGTYYQCIQVHAADAADNEPGVGTNWTDYWTALPGKPDWYDYQHDGEIWEEEGLGAITNIYAPWDRGWPEVVAFHQQRCILMATEDYPAAIWGSRIGEYENLNRGVNADDGFFFDLATSDSPKIKWAESTQTALPIGTSSGDYLMSSQVTLGPTDIQVTKQNAARSENRRAVVIGTEVYYIERGREKIRSTSYLDNINAWQSKDMTFMAEHLLHQRVKRLAIMRTPEVVIFGVREDGTLICATFLAAEPSALAFYEFTSPGEMKDVWIQYDAAIGEDVLYVSITYDGGDTHYIEKMPYPTRALPDIDTLAESEDDSLTDRGIVHIDSWQTLEITDQQDIGVATWFADGETIRVTLDDAWMGDFVVTRGVISLEEEFTGTLAFGYPYNGYAKTFEYLRGSPSGAGFGMKRKMNRIFVRLLNSALVKINGDLPQDRTPSTPMDVPETYRLGVQDVDIRNAGWDDGSVEIVQDRPYPTQVVGIFGEHNVGTT